MDKNDVYLTLKICIYKFTEMFEMKIKQYRRLRVDTRQKNMSNRAPDMTCFAAKRLKFDSR